MPERRQKVRHTESAADLYVGLQGQLTVDTTNSEVRVHDGSTAGGHGAARKDLTNVAAATAGSDGKMSAAQAGNLVQVVSDLDALEALVAALDGEDIAFDDTDLLVTAADLQTALEAYDAVIVAEIASTNAHEANTGNPHSVTAAQAAALAIANDLSDLASVATALTNLGLSGDDSIWAAGTETAKKAPSPANIRSAINSYLNWPAGHRVVNYGATTPAGCLPCDGAAVSRTTYSALFTRIGTTFGAGDGSTTFNVPNEVNNFTVGSGDTYARGATGGEAEHTLIEDEMPSHAHGIASGTQASTAGASVFTVGTNTSTFSTATGGDQPHNNLPPYLAVPVYITTGGV